VLSKQIALPAAGAESPSIGAGNFIWQPRHLTRTPKLHSLHLSPVVATSHIMMMRKCRVHLFSDSVMVQESGFRIWNGGWGMLDSGCGVLARHVGLRLCWDACKEIAHKNSIKIAIYVRGPWKRVAKSMRKLMWLLL